MMDQPSSSSQASTQHNQSDAHNRAITDYNNSALFGRLGAQMSFFANGGAAITMLTFLNNIITSQKNVTLFDPQKLSFYFSISAAFFLSGIMSAILALIFLSKSRESWGHFWQNIAESRQSYSTIDDFQLSDAKKEKYALHEYLGAKYNIYGFRFLVLSLVLFGPGSIFALIPLLS